MNRCPYKYLPTLHEQDSSRSSRIKSNQSINQSIKQEKRRACSTRQTTSASTVHAPNRQNMPDFLILINLIFSLLPPENFHPTLPYPTPLPAFCCSKTSKEGTGVDGTWGVRCWSWIACLLFFVYEDGRTNRNVGN